ncbi:MAG TPA: S8 family serine peptidase [Actinoplanes sp.]|nr:S8 family serine peptidase [Actinoplanes sp.]
MRKHLRRYAAGALTVGAIAGGAALGLPTQAAADWQPVVSGLSESAQQMLPESVSAAKPVRVVRTSITKGKPVVEVRTATDRGTAAELVKDAQQSKGAVAVEVDSVVTALDGPAGTDPYRAQQWDFGKLHVADAWQQSTGAGVTVAVIDSGVDASHPDLAGQILPGKDFVAGTEGTSTDPNGHGTHVAGTIAALTGNGTGVSAVAPGAKILPVRVLGANGTGWTSDIASGIIYAADHGAKVINMSLGGPGQSTTMSNAIAYARSKGVTVIAAAGNERQDGSPVSYPAADAGVIAVAATDAADKVASYSNQGSYVDVAAPGSNILSTVPVAKGSYASYNGTSMATPHVAAVAALMKAANPGLTPDAIESALESSAVDLGPAGKDTDYGYGRIDALAAVTAVAPATSAPTSAPATTTAPVTTAPTTVPTTAPTANPTSTPSKTVTPTPSKTVVPTPSKTVTPTPSKTVTPSPSKTVTPTPTKPKVRPSIRVAASTSAPVYGSTVRVTYTVTASGKPYAGKPVRIGVALPKGSFAFTGATTNSAGVVAFTRKATGNFQVKLLVPASATTLEATSGVSGFTVRTQIRVTSPAKRTLKVALTGATGQRAQVQRLDRSRWVVAKTVTASAAQLKVTGLKSAARYRVVVPSTATLKGVTSPILKIR